MRISWFGKRGRVEDECARKEEFVNVFRSERMGLKQLAFLLTANAEKADRCLLLALRECTASSSVSRAWVHTWTRRAVIRIAIGLVTGSEGQSSIETIDAEEESVIGLPVEDPSGSRANSMPILDLPEFDRLVFVICVLERYSVHDCALLLGRSPTDVYAACRQTAVHVERIGEGLGGPLRVALH